VELGAQYIHGEGHALFQFAKARNFIAPQDEKFSEEYFLDNGKTVLDDWKIKSLKNLRTYSSRPQISYLSTNKLINQ
jgi:hypothetical protein